MKSHLPTSLRFGLATRPLLSFFACATLFATSVCEAQQAKQFVVRFVNHTGERLRLEVIRPQYEDLGLLKVNEVTEIDFDRGEKVRVTYVRTGAQRGILDVDGNKTLKIYNPNDPQLSQKAASVSGGGTSGGIGVPGGGGGGSGFDGVGAATTGGGGRITAMGGQAESLQAEMRSALKMVNNKRRELGIAPLKFNDRLQKTALRRANDMAARTKHMNDIFQTTDHEFMDPLTGQTIGANTWAREDGYRLAEFEGNQNTIESTHGYGGSGTTLKGAGQAVIRDFLSEGPGGGHYEAMVSPADKDFAFAAVMNANRTAVVTCVLTASEEAGGPANMGTGSGVVGNGLAAGQSGTSGQNGLTGLNGNSGSENSTNGQTTGSLVSFLVVNQSQTDVPVYENDRANGTSRLIGVANAGKSQRFDVSPQNTVRVSTPGGLQSVLATSSKVTIPPNTATLNIKYTTEVIKLYLFLPKLEQRNGTVTFDEVAQPVSQYRGGKTIQQEVPVGTRVVIKTDLPGSIQQKILKDTTIDLTKKD